MSRFLSMALLYVGVFAASTVEQRLAFARVLLAAPRIDLLEGPGTLLGTDAAVHLIGLLQERSITVVTFAPDEALAAHHDLRLVLEAGGM